MMAVTGISFRLIAIWLTINLFGNIHADYTCESPQYLPVGQKGTIKCRFPESFYGVYWYLAQNLTSDDRPFLSHRQGSAYGSGYDSGEYDIDSNGSLIINTVSSQHNRYFTVNILRSPTDDPQPRSIHVIVYATPVGHYPNIGCEDKNLCFVKVESTTSLSCSIDGVGDIIDDISWELRSKSRNKSTSSQQVIVPISSNELISHRVTVNVPLEESPALSLYVYSSKSPVPKVGSSEAAILVNHGTRKSNELSPILLEKPLNESVTMGFGRGLVFSLTWQKEDDDEPIAYSVLSTAGERIQKINREGFKLEEDYSLTINVIDERCVGVYICLYSEDGITTSYIAYDVQMQGKGNEGLYAGIIVVISVVILVVVVTAVLFLFMKRRKKKTKSEYGDQSQTEGLPMMKETGLSSSIITFKNENQARDEETLRILETRSGAQVKLANSFLSVDNGGAALHLTSGVVLHPTSTIRRLDFDFPSNQWRAFNSFEFKGVLQYAAGCASLEEIQFCNSLLPFEFGDDIEGIIPMKLKKIEWLTITLGVSLELNYETGKWEKFDGEVLTKNEHYKIMEDAQCSADVGYI